MSTPQLPAPEAPPQDSGPRSLAELEARFARDLELLTLPPRKEWLEPQAHPQWGPMLDVAIVGAGMAGLAAAFALKSLGVRRLQVFDRAPRGFEGPWATHARMEVLRSPPELTGPAFQFANLTFRAWFEAQFGRAAWQRLHRIPRLQWMDYLRWYRSMIDVAIENETELIDLGGDASAVRLTLRSAAGVRQLAARRLVLATGRDGLGGPYVPAMFGRLDRRFWAHTSDGIDYAPLRGKAVAVIGAGASAVDAAAEALEAGAACAAMLVRRPDVPRINKTMGIGSPGFWLGFGRLSPAQRMTIMRYIDDQGVPPPRDSMLRCARHRNFSIIARCEVRKATVRDGRVLLDTTRGHLAFDYVVLATGLAIDWSQRPELAALKSHVLTWRDGFTLDEGGELPHADDPFLGPDLEFLPRERDHAPWVERVHCLAFPANMSHGPITGDIPGISIGAQRVADGIAAALLAEDYAGTWRRLNAWDNPELRGDEYVLDEDVAPSLRAEGEAIP
jgi:cation diffusion facilitator CzcD-associated flavoprotein CzcO